MPLLDSLGYQNDSPVLVYSFIFLVQCCGLHPQNNIFLTTLFEIEWKPTYENLCPSLSLSFFSHYLSQYISVYPSIYIPSFLSTYFCIYLFIRYIHPCIDLFHLPIDRSNYLKTLALLRSLLARSVLIQ